jgi:hypothetical protein
VTTPILLQGWKTISGATSTNWNQQVDDCADLHHFKDVTAFVEVSDFSNVTVVLQQAVAKDATFFYDIDAGFAPAATGLTVLPYRYSGFTISRWMRWRAFPTAAGAWRVTLRIWLAANMSGNYRRAHVHRDSLARHLQMHADHAKRAAKNARLASDD